MIGKGDEGIDGKDNFNQKSHDHFLIAYNTLKNFDLDR